LLAGDRQIREFVMNLFAGVIACFFLLSFFHISQVNRNYIDSRKRKEQNALSRIFFWDGAPGPPAGLPL
jgi:hypothetical protein